MKAFAPAGKKTFTNGEKFRRKRKAPSAVLPKMKKELALSWSSVAERLKYLSSGLCSMIPSCATFTVANQVRKFRAMRAYAAMVGYCAILCIPMEIDHGRAPMSFR